MKKNLYALLPISLAMLLGGCSGDDSSDSFVKSDSYPADGSSVESIYDLGSCNSDRDGDIIFVEDEEHNFLCHKEKWEDIGEPESSSSKKGSSDDISLSRLTNCFSISLRSRSEISPTIYSQS